MCIITDVCILMFIVCMCTVAHTHRDTYLYMHMHLFLDMRDVVVRVLNM